jgi:hypothetical protein
MRMTVALPDFRPIVKKISASLSNSAGGDDYPGR